jgi:hypothetical protein
MNDQLSGLCAAVLILASAGCAGRGNDWPTLMTPEEQRTGKAAAATPPPVAATPVQPVTQPPPSPKLPDGATTGRIRAQTSRLAEAKRDADYISARWDKQKASLANLGASIKQKGPSDVQWNKAQLELTKLSQIAAEWDDLDSVVNRVAGQLAMAAHQGDEVAAVLTEAGALLTRIEAAKADAAREREALRRKFSL